MPMDQSSTGPGGHFCMPVQSYDGQGAAPGLRGRYCASAELDDWAGEVPEWVFAPALTHINNKHEVRVLTNPATGDGRKQTIGRRHGASRAAKQVMYLLDASGGACGYIL